MSAILPKDVLKRLELVGIEVFGPRWKLDTAKRIGVSRVGMLKWLSKQNRPPADLDRRLIALLESSREFSEQQVVRRTALIEALSKIVD